MITTEDQAELMEAVAMALPLPDGGRIPPQPATPLEIQVAEICQTTPHMIRFFGYRLGVEITLGRPLIRAEALRLGSMVYNSFPEKSHMARKARRSSG